MRLIPSVASYLGLQNRVREALTDEHLAVLARVAVGPITAQEVSEEVLTELIAMHAVKVENEEIKLSTAVFLEDDILQVAAVANALGQALAERLMEVGKELLDASPEVRNFLGGIIGAAQGPSQLLRATGQAISWKDYQGKYASTKVDFDQDCPALSALGPELQVKTLLRGEQYTAVFIGPGGITYPQLINRLYPVEYRAYRNQLLKYLTDSYGRLLAGELQSESLAFTAEEAGIFQEGHPRPILLTKTLFAGYRATVERIAQASREVYSDSISQVFTCLRETTSGRQGVPPEKMIMHFGRYCRKALGKELYAAGFFTDQVPQNGSITIFFENDISELNSYLG